MQQHGVITAADANYFPGLVGLHWSIQTSWPCPIACYDIGLTPEQRGATHNLSDLTILDLPDDPLISALEDATRQCKPLAKASKRIWPLWICPLLIRAAPFRNVFWIDCDILVLRGLNELFERLADGPVFTPENKAPQLTPNSPRLYELLPIARPFDSRVPAVNGGVSGWRKGRDDAALAAYIHPVAAAVRVPEIMDAISWHDQGALIWAIQSLGLDMGDPKPGTGKSRFGIPALEFVRGLRRSASRNVEVGSGSMRPPSFSFAQCSSAPLERAPYALADLS